MKRRRYLETLGSGITVGIATLAGCASPTDEETDVTAVDTARAETPTEGAATATGTVTATGTTTGERTATGTETSDGAVTNTVEMVSEGSDFYFDPVGLFVEPGETILWRNESGSHSSTAYVPNNPQAEVRRIPEEAEGWDSGTLTEQGATFEHTFEVPGTYDYFCTPHKSLGMIARLVVGEPGGVEGNPPDGNVPTEQRIVKERVVGFEEFQGG